MIFPIDRITMPPLKIKTLDTLIMKYVIMTCLEFWFNGLLLLLVLYEMRASLPEVLPAAVGEIYWSWWVRKTNVLYWSTSENRNGPKIVCFSMLMERCSLQRSFTASWAVPSHDAKIDFGNGSRTETTHYQGVSLHRGNERWLSIDKKSGEYPDHKMIFQRLQATLWQ